MMASMPLNKIPSLQSAAPAVRVELPRRRDRAGDASYQRRAVDCLRVAPGLAPAQRAAVEAVHSQFPRKGGAAGDVFVFRRSQLDPVVETIN